jgi:hypothetical protein
VFTLLTALLASAPAADPLPAGSAVLVAHSVLKSEDGTHAVQLATFGFPMSKPDAELLARIMNSDGYWNHFRHHQTFLRVGETDTSGGPRIVTRGALAELLVKDKDKLPAHGWTATYVLPGNAKLVGEELTFASGDGNSKPGAQFAKVKLTEKDVTAATVPFRATIKEAGAASDGHYVLFATNHVPARTDLRLGDAKPTTLLFSIFYGEGKGWRHSNHDELVANFKDAPAKDAAVAMKFHGVEGWYKAETVVAKPKK